MRCLFDPWIRDSKWVKNQGSGSGSGINNPDHISESKETVLWVKMLKLIDVDLGSGMEKIRILDPWMNIPDPQTLISIF
jgi:hypothetical protein